MWDQQHAQSVGNHGGELDGFGDGFDYVVGLIRKHALNVLTNPNLTAEGAVNAHNILTICADCIEGDK